MSSISRVGGGSLPLEELPTMLVAMAPDHMSANDLEKRLRLQDPPVVARIVDDKLCLDLRTVASRELSDLEKGIRYALLDTETRRRGDTEKIPKSESRKEARKERARIHQEKAKELNPLKNKVKSMENAVGEMEVRIEGVNEELVKASTDGDGARIAELSKKLSDLNETLETQYQELFEKTEELEQKEKEWTD
jgi:chromosome segregation ATPase